ncbi:DMT family transporter [Marinobacter pelagius]|uniref:DMT family transporter n=1 Tax=Marinobacter sp. C7 TaxID=2951363 RepID=UPI001EF02BC2|nr:DMT family transporter [Marinobacter sp. C7]
MTSLRMPITMPNTLSIFAALFAVMLWASAPLLVATAHSIPPFQLTTIALISGAVAVLPMSLRGRHRRQSVRISWKWKLVIFGLVPLLVLGAVGAYLIGLGMAPTAEASLITYTWPVMFILISQWLFHRRIALPVIAGALIAFSGAALLLAPEALNNGFSGNMAGYGLALLAGVCWALYSWICQATPVAIAPAMPGLFLLAGAGAAAAETVSGSATVLPSGTALAAGIALGLGPYGLAMVAWDLALRKGPTALVGSLAYAVPVLAALFLVLAGIAAPDWRLPLAALLVVLGSLVASGRRRA